MAIVFPEKESRIESGSTSGASGDGVATLDFGAPNFLVAVMLSSLIMHFLCTSRSGPKDEEN